MLRSASVRTNRFGELPNNSKVIKSGLLKGVVFLPTDQGIARWGGYRIFDDPKLGIMIEKE